MIFQFIIQPGIDQTAVASSSNFVLVFWLVLAIVIMIVAAIGIKKLMSLLHQPELHGLDRKKIGAMWIDIEKTSDQGVMGAKLALIEADKLLDNVFKSMFLPGETFAERLKVATYKYPKVRQVWSGHRLRNQLVHDSSFEVSPRQVKIALREYEAALKTLNVL
ncbi:hypothetical protein EXS71_00950 [Candidatus Uhrbacteria bacterium]|nr:hypothetical protein [Candidatus Uhrbacteria bacterium]